MNTEMTKKQMEVGKKYRGWASLNEYGQINFTPEQTGVAAGSKKLVTEGNGYSVYETKKKVVVHMSLDKTKEKRGLLTQFFQQMNVLTEILHKYAF